MRKRQQVAIKPVKHVDPQPQSLLDVVSAGFPTRFDDGKEFLGVPLIDFGVKFVPTKLVCLFCNLFVTD